MGVCLGSGVKRLVSVVAGLQFGERVGMAILQYPVVCGVSCN